MRIWKETGTNPSNMEIDDLMEWMNWVSIVPSFEDEMLLRLNLIIQLLSLQKGIDTDKLMEDLNRNPLELEEVKMKNKKDKLKSQIMGFKNKGKKSNGRR